MTLIQSWREVDILDWNLNLWRHDQRYLSSEESVKPGEDPWEAVLKHVLSDLFNDEFYLICVPWTHKHIKFQVTKPSVRKFHPIFC